MKGTDIMYNYEILEQYALKISSRIGFAPKVGIVLGSGMGDIADKINAVYTFAFNDISGFPMTTVEGHAGQFIFGYIEDVPIVCMQGRIHYYEGFSMEDVVLPIRFMAIMGVETLILTNAAGGINKDFDVGDMVLITDHISTFVPNPLINKNVDSLGDRFPDMSCVYDEKIRNTMKDISKCGSGRRCCGNVHRLRGYRCKTRRNEGLRYLARYEQGSRPRKQGAFSQGRTGCGS